MINPDRLQTIPDHARRDAGLPLRRDDAADGTIVERAEDAVERRGAAAREQDFRDARRRPSRLHAHLALSSARSSSCRRSIISTCTWPVASYQQAIAFGQVAEIAVEQYRLLDQQRVNVQRAFAIMYAIITLMLLLSRRSGWASPSRTASSSRSGV